VLSHSLNPAYLAGLSFSQAQLSSIQRLGESKGRQALFVARAPEKLDRLRASAIVQSSESSNRIEGVTAPHPRIEALIKHSTEPQNRSEQEIAGYRDALQLIHESHEDMPLNLNLILQVHALLFRYLPREGGHLKPSDNEIVERDSEGTIRRVRFRPTPAVLTRQALSDLEASYHDATARASVEPLVLVPLAVLDFLCIHPFRDGNGRVARLLTLLLLYHHGYDVGRYISLERIVEDSKESYYETLEASSRHWHEGQHDAVPWITYFWGVLIRAYDEFEQQVAVLLSGPGSKTDFVRETVLNLVSPFSIKELESACPAVSRDMIRHVLRQMKSEGRVTPEGRGRAARWRLT
jgi:Fic family protein